MKRRAETDKIVIRKRLNVQENFENIVKLPNLYKVTKSPSTNEKEGDRNGGCQMWRKALRARKTLIQSGLPQCMNRFRIKNWKIHAEKIEFPVHTAPENGIED